MFVEGLVRCEGEKGCVVRLKKEQQLREQQVVREQQQKEAQLKEQAQQPAPKVSD